VTPVTCHVLHSLLSCDLLYLSHVILSLIVCYLSSVKCYLLWVIVSPVMCHILPVTFHLSFVFVTYHMMKCHSSHVKLSPFIFQMSHYTCLMLHTINYMTCPSQLFVKYYLLHATQSPLICYMLHFTIHSVSRHELNVAYYMSHCHLLSDICYL